MTPIMLFAAGLGTRMGALTAHQPKPMIRVAGKPLIDHALELTIDQPLQTPVINVHYKSEVLKQHLSDRQIIFSDETDKLRDTGGGLRHALPHLGTGPAMTLNTDAIWSGPNPITHLLSEWRDEMEGLLLIVPKDRVIGHKGPGDFAIGPDGRLKRDPGHIYSGLQIIRTEGLHNIAEDVFSLNRLWDQMISHNSLYGTTYTGRWCDVGQPESITLAEDLIAEGQHV